MTEKDNKEPKGIKYPCPECNNPFPPHQQCLIITNLKLQNGIQEIIGYKDLMLFLQEHKDLARQLKNQTCGHHPGMSCKEAHLDDKMRIDSLERQLKEANIKLESKCEYHVQLDSPADKKIESLEQQVRELREKLNEKF